MGSNSGFICFDGYLERTSKLSDQELGRLMRALMNYHANGTEPALKGREGIAFDFIREDIDRTDRKYAEKCEQNRRNRQGKQNDDGRRTTTTDNDRQRSSTTDDDRERTATNSDDGGQIKRKIKRENLFSDDDDDISAHAEKTETEILELAVDQAFQKSVGRQAAPAEQEEIAISARLLGFSITMVQNAIRIAAGAGATNIVGYTRSILDDWKRNDVETPEEAEEHKFLYDAWTGKNEYGTGTGEDLQRMRDAQQRRKEKHAEETA